MRLLPRLLALGGLGLVVACGGGRTGSLEDDAPTVELLFPPLDTVGDAAVLPVLVVTKDASPTAAVRIGDVPAVSTNKTHWRAVVPVDPIAPTSTYSIDTRDVLENEGIGVGAARVGNDVLPAPAAGLVFYAGQTVMAYAGRLAAVDAAGARSRLASLNVGTGVGLQQPADVLRDDPANARYLVVDAGIPGIVAVSDATPPGASVRTLLSGGAEGSGDAFMNPAGAVRDGVRLLVVDAGRTALMSVTIADGMRAILSANTGMKGTGTKLESLSGGIALDGARALVSDVTTKAIVAIDLATGNRSVLSGGTTGSGPEFMKPTALDIDTAGGRLLVVDEKRPALMAVVLATGARSILSDAMVGTGPLLTRPGAITFDAATSSVYVADYPDGLLRIDLATGNRTSVYTLSRGTGAAFGKPSALVVGEEGKMAYVLDGAPARVLKVDLATGARAVLSDTVQAGTTDLREPYDVVHDKDRKWLLVSDPGAGAVFEVRLPGGERRVVTGPTEGTGPGIAALRGVAADGDNHAGFVADASIPAVLRFDLRTGNRTVIAGPAAPGAGMLRAPHGLVFRRAQNALLIADRGAGKVFKLDLATGAFSEASTVTEPERLTFRAGGTRVIAVGSEDHSAVHDVSQAKSTEIMRAGDGRAPGVSRLRGAAFGLNEHVLYVTDELHRFLLAVDRESGERTVVSR